MLSTITFHNFLRSTSFILAVSPSEVIYKLKFKFHFVVCQIKGHMTKPGHLPCALIWRTAKSFFFHFSCSLLLALSIRVVNRMSEHMSGVSGHIPGVSELSIGCLNTCPEYSDIYAEYPGRRLDVQTHVRIFSRVYWRDL